MTSFDVRVFAIRRRAGRRAFEVRWRVAVHDRSRSFMPRALAACPRTGTAWTSAGTSLEPRGLKHRPDGTIRIAPSRPSWSARSASTCTRSAPRRTGGPSAAPAAACSANRCHRTVITMRERERLCAPSAVPGTLSAYLHRAVIASGSAMAVSATTLRVQEFDKGRGPVGLPPIG